MASADTITVQGVAVPRFMYGTAWKEERTEALTALALQRGFRAVDTANQRKHYFEAGAGAAIQAALADGTCTRDDLFIQTKFTYRRGQDHRLPYDPAAAPALKVAQSLASSLEHLGLEYLDAYVLHGPDGQRGLSRMDVKVWSAMERAYADGLTKLIGISNVSLRHVQQLVRKARVKPAFVQNRCYARFGWDRDVRAFCRDHDIVYQGFSLLTANGRELSHPDVVAMAQRLKVTVPQLVFAWSMAVGMLPLTGTSSEQHMREDLAAQVMRLSESDVVAFEQLTTP